MGAMARVNMDMKARHAYGETYHLVFIKGLLAMLAFSGGRIWWKPGRNFSARKNDFFGSAPRFFRRCGSHSSFLVGIVVTGAHFSSRSPFSTPLFRVRTLVSQRGNGGGLSFACVRALRLSSGETKTLSAIVVAGTLIGELRGRLCEHGQEITHTCNKFGAFTALSTRSCKSMGRFCGNLANCGLLRAGFCGLASVDVFNVAVMAELVGECAGNDLATWGSAAVDKSEGISVISGGWVVVDLLELQTGRPPDSRPTTLGFMINCAAK